MRGDLYSLAFFEVGRGAARPGTRIGILLFTLILAANHFEAWMGRPPSDGLFGAAYAVGLIGVLCFGLAADRRLGFDAYLLANHVAPLTYIGAKVVAMMALLLAYGVLTGVVEAVFSLGGISQALWSAAALTLIGFLIVPPAMLVESIADTSMPAAFVLIAFTVAVVAFYIARGSLGLLDVTGIGMLEPGDWSSVGPLALNVLLGAFPALGLVVLLASLRLPRC